MIFQTEKEIEVLRDEAALINSFLVKGEFGGDLAEVGVFEGGTARIIRETIPGPALHLFDTFTGLPDKMTSSDPKHYEVGHMAVDKSIPKELAKMDNTFVYPGIFPATSKPIKDKTFAFVHIDVDIYQTTLDALEFFYPRMEIGGSIIVHDYPAHPGVLKAVDEFMEGKGTQHLHKWRVWKKDPMIRSGFRQLIIRKRWNT